MKKSTSTFQLISPKPLFQWVDGELVEREGEGLVHREVHYSFHTWWPVICGFTFMREREMVFQWENLSKPGEKQQGTKRKIFTVCSSVSTYLHTFLYLYWLYCGFFFSFFCATWWKYHCWTRDILVALELKSSSFVPCHLSPLFPLISCHLAFIFCSYLVCYHYKTCY